MDGDSHGSSSLLQDTTGEKTILEKTDSMTPSGDSPTGQSVSSSPGSSKGLVRYSFLIRPFQGYTGRIRRCLTNEPSPTPMTFLYEGPYGTVHNLDRFNDVLLVIGGSGISVGISYIYNALEQNPSSRLRLVWTCRSKQSYMDSILSKELRSALATGRLEVEA